MQQLSLIVVFIVSTGFWLGSTSASASMKVPGKVNSEVLQILDSTNAYNNRKIQPGIAGMADEDCEDRPIERVWKTAIQGEDERFLDDENPYAALVVYKNLNSTTNRGHYGTIAAYGENKAVTAAHVFFKNGKWLLTDSSSKPTKEQFKKIIVRVNGCREANGKWVEYRVEDIKLMSTEIDDYMTKESVRDIAKVYLDKPVCDEGQVQFYEANAKEDQRLLNKEFPVKLSSFQDLKTNKNRSLKLASNESVSRDLNSSKSDVHVVTDENYVLNVMEVDGQTVYEHGVDSVVGNSGGPLIVPVPNGKRPLMIGVHIGAKIEGVQMSGNTALKLTGPVAEFLRD